MSNRLRALQPQRPPPSPSPADRPATSPRRPGRRPQVPPAARHEHLGDPGPRMGPPPPGVHGAPGRRWPHRAGPADDDLLTTPALLRPHPDGEVGSLGRLSTSILVWGAAPSSPSPSHRPRPSSLLAAPSERPGGRDRRSSSVQDHAFDGLSPRSPLGVILLRPLLMSRSWIEGEITPQGFGVSQAGALLFSRGGPPISLLYSSGLAAWQTRTVTLIINRRSVGVELPRRAGPGPGSRPPHRIGY